MSDNLEETSFDYIVLGTGLIESILAGSLARIGKKVLHLDSHQNYGGNWSVFGFRELAQWYIERNKAAEDSLTEGDLSINYENNYSANYRNVELNLFTESEVKQQTDEEENETVPQEPTVSSMDKDLYDAFFLSNSSSNGTKHAMAEKQLFADLLKSSRSYNLDSTPKFLGSRDALVETLIRSGVGRYLEFKSVDDIYILDQSLKSLEKVPSSKEDIFINKSVSLIEKRKLMKFLTFAMEYDENDAIFEGTEEMNYTRFLQEKFKITGKLQQAIVYAIAMVDDKASVKNGLESTHKFVRAMGRFGKGAYLCPLYGGASEIAQAFCRVCAVYGGIYILNQALDKYVVDEETKKITGIVTKEGQEYKCNTLIAGIDYLNNAWLPQKDDFGSWVKRAIVVTDTPLVSVNTETFVADGLSYSVFPPGNEAGNAAEPIYAINQSQESMACPKNQYVTYLWTTAKEESTLKKATDLLLQKKKQITEENNDSTTEISIRILFNAYFEQRVRSSINSIEANTWNLPEGVIPCSDPDISLNFESAFAEAVKIFHDCESAEAEFMPATEQDPEEDY